ncbi:MAG: molecular chaperone DnaJ [Bacteroidetes bacterium]|nr:molecular chaperone DnaJ [Bacteroidota bacterium]
MSEKRDYYEVLGVEKNATAEELKKAYRRAAIKYHPDKNPDDKSAEDKFKEAAEAFDILGNPDKRARYDQFGHAGMNGNGGFGGGGQAGGFSMDDIFEQFGDIFGGGGGSFGGFGGSSRQGRRVNKGSDLRVKVRMTLKEILHGADKKLKIAKMTTCTSCHGTGAKDENSYSSCSNCNGSGYITRVVNSFFGPSQTTQACPNCKGTGKIIINKCSSCHGEGVVKADEVIEIHIPAGVGKGMQLSVSGKGNAAQNGGINGDLLIVIDEIADPQLKREGNDLIYNMRLSITQAIFGDTIEVPTVDGKARVKIDKGTSAGKVLRLRGKGLPDVNGYGVGDILICTDIYIPTKLSKEEHKALESIKDSENLKPKKTDEPNIFERVKSFFN